MEISAPPPGPAEAKFLNDRWLEIYGSSKSSERKSRKARRCQFCEPRIARVAGG